jgi:integrase
MAKTPTPRKHGNRWQINFLDADGKRRFKSYRTKSEAQDALHLLNAESLAIRAGLQARPLEPHTFDELTTYWLDHRASRKRSGKDDKSIINCHLLPFFGGMQLGDIDVRTVDRFRAQKGHLSPKTVHNLLTLLISMLGLAVELRWLAVKPTIKKPRLVEADYSWIRTTEAIRQLLTAAQEEVPGAMELYATAVYTGMRAGELLGLRWEDVDLERRLITVKRSYDKPTKTGAIRHVPILNPLMPLLPAWKLRGGSEWVFPNRAGNMRQPADRIVQEKLKACLERAGLERIRFHDLRHTFASHWVMNGGDLFKLQRILGHKSAAMTQRYAHLAPEAFKDDLDRLGDATPLDAEVVELRPSGS